MKQRGVVLFFALIAMLAIMLAAVALVRSVDTSTIIAGNLAFKQAATVSGDAGTEAAITWLTAIDTDPNNSAWNVLTDAPHPFNITNLAANPGYYSNADPALNLFADATWDNDTPANPNNTSLNSVLVGVDSGGNKVRYVIQRVCRNPNAAIRDADCLFSGAIVDTNGQNIKLPQEICKGSGCPAAGQSPQIRITSRTTGPKNTLSYVQAFVY